MIERNKKFNIFSKQESYAIPYTKASLDKAAAIAALIVLEELESKAFGVSMDTGFEGVVMVSDIKALKKQILEKSSELDIDQYLK